MQQRAPNPKLEEQYQQQGSCCFYCGEEVPFDKITKDHFNPRSKGNNFINNKVFACRLCNTLKGDKSIDDFHKDLLKKCCGILEAVVNQKFKISEIQLTRFKHYSKVASRLHKMLQEGGKPNIIFT